MREIFVKWICVSVVALLLGCNTATISKPATSKNVIPLRDFFKNPEQGRFQVSPDGKYLSLMKPWENRMNIFVQRLSEDRLPVGEQKQITFVKDRDLAGYFWKGNDTILYSKDFGGDENFHIFAVDVNTNTQKDLTPFEKVRATVIDDLEDISDTDVLFQMNKRNPEIFDAFRLNIKTGEMKMIAENPGKYEGWGTDQDGNIRVAVESDGLKTRIYTRKSEKDKFKKILEFDYKNTFDPLFFTFDNKDLYGSSNLGRDKSAIVKINPETGKEKEILFKHPEVDVESLSFSKKRKVITAASFTTWKNEFKFFDKISKARYEKIKSQIGDYEVLYTGHNKDEDLFTVVATSDKTRGRYYLYDEKNNRLTFLADVSPWLDPNKLATMKPIQYKSRDGLTIHGYLTLPNGTSGKNLPVIVNPHGGPWARDEWGFNPEIQFLANRGYAVLQMNYRGSTGYGKDFFIKSFKQWGKKMQDDITDGVQWLISQGIADPKRVGIYGGSYGGYATLAGITFTPDLYTCAVDYVGVSNLFTFMKTIPPYWKTELEKMYAMVGNPEKDVVLMREASPVFHTDKIKTPLFVAQGAKDPRVNINESNQIVDSLKKRGVTVKYMVKENEGHGFHNEENRFDFYEAMEEFFKDHLK
jgi:dipeptidyl aminopeptidase/acylaminoacyl peptidase